MAKKKINNGIKCAVCGENAKCVFDEEGIKSYLCFHCGMRYDIEFPEDKECYPFYNSEVEDHTKNENHGCSYNCPVCDHYVILSGNFMRSEWCGDVDEEDVDENGLYNDDVIVDNMICPHCGAVIAAIPCKPSEEKDYPYFKEEDRYKIDED